MSLYRVMLSLLWEYMLIYCSGCVCLCVCGCTPPSFLGCSLSTRRSKRWSWMQRTPQDGSTSSPLNSSQRWDTHTETHTPTLSRRKLCIDKWSTPQLNVDPAPDSIQTGRLSPNTRGMFNFAIANQWFTSVPSNLGQTGEAVERHDNPLWLRCSTDKTSPRRPPHDRRKPVRPRSSA